MNTYFNSKIIGLHQDNDVLLMLHFIMQKTIYKHNLPKKIINQNDPTFKGSSREHLPSKIKENENLSKKIIPQYLKHIIDNKGDKQRFKKELKAYKNDLNNLRNRLHYEIQKLDYLTI